MHIQQVDAVRVSRNSVPLAIDGWPFSMACAVKCTGLLRTYPDRPEWYFHRNNLFRSFPGNRLLELHFMDRFRYLDWNRPWYAAVRERGQPIAQAPDWRAALNAAAGAQHLCNRRGLPISFVPQQALPHGTAYEAFISDCGQVPTRDNLHDFFNALVWLTFPRIKAQLNALQAAELAHGPDSAAKSRGPIRDGATLFDENAALVVLRDSPQGHALAQALRDHRWYDAFLGQHAAFRSDCQVFLFGHALMEKLAKPYKAITAHAWLLVADDDFFSLLPAGQYAWADAIVARQLTGGLAPSGFTPLPLMGVPGWSASQEEAFYADTAVFRPKRMRVD